MKHMYSHIAYCLYTSVWLIFDQNRLSATDHNQDTKREVLIVAPNTTQRQTRSMIHNHDEVGLQLDEDNALVAIDDEDETSQTPTSSSDGYEDDGINLKNDCSDTLTVNIVLYIKIWIHEFL